MQKKEKTFFWSLLAIIFLLFAIIFGVRTIHKFEVWKGHEQYLKSNNKTVEDWMPPNLIEKETGIAKDLIYDGLGIEETFVNNRRPLNELCAQEKLNCTIVVERLRAYTSAIKQGKKGG